MATGSEGVLEAEQTGVNEEAPTDEVPVQQERDQLKVSLLKKNEELQRLSSELKSKQTRLARLEADLAEAQARAKVETDSRDAMKELKDDNAVNAQLLSSLGLRRNMLKMAKEGGVDLNDDNAFNAIDRLVGLEMKEAWIEGKLNRAKGTSDPEVMRLLNLTLERLQHLEQKDAERSVIEEMQVRFDQTMGPVVAELQKMKQRLDSIGSGTPQESAKDEKIVQAIEGFGGMIKEAFAPMLKNQVAKQAEPSGEPQTQEQFDQAATEVVAQFAAAAKTRPELDRGIGWTEMQYPHFGPSAQPLAQAFISHLRSRGRLNAPAIQPLIHSNGWVLFHKEHYADLRAWLASDEYRRLTGGAGAAKGGR